jgi:GH15 family glucan-1,4-alpha-glucosidase
LLPCILSALLALAPLEAARAAAASWLAQNCATPSGAFRVRPGGGYVSGYFGTLIADALVRSRQRPDLALSWMQWYVTHAHDSGSGIDGVPDDIDLVGDTEVSRNRPDSTDAYGAVFLMLARDAFDSGDPALRAYVLAHPADLRRIADSSVATMQPNGLTWSRPQYHMFYAIDNVQVYRGLIDAADLFRRAFSDAQTAARYEQRAVAVKHGIDTVLWDPSTQSFRPYMNELGTSGSANLAQSYPDALAQVLAIYYGAIDPQSPAASALIDRASPALLASGDPLDEHRLILLAAKKRLGQRIELAPFEPPALCIDAAWYLDILT